MSLHLSHFSCHQFRNLKPTQLQLHPQFNFFYGNNGQGKTNVLEAIYFLLTLRPLRPVRTKQLICWGEQFASVRGNLEARISKELGVHFDASQKRLKLNGGPPLSWDDYFEETRIVSFTPEEIQLVRGAPELRRKFLDRAIFNTQVSYLKKVREYLRILSQRNALLKQHTVDTSFLEVLNEQFVEKGSLLVFERIKLVQRLTLHLLPAYKTIFPDVGDCIDLHYQSALNPFTKKSGEESREVSDADLMKKIQQQFFQILEKKHVKEKERRISLVGPHLDDLNFTFMQQPFKTSASQGQTRGLILALKISEIRDIEERTGSYPILLLDDVAGELDPKHASYLFQFLEDSKCQILLSTTSMDYINMKEKNRYPHFHVEDGSIQVD